MSSKSFLKAIPRRMFFKEFYNFWEIAVLINQLWTTTCEGGMESKILQHYFSSATKVSFRSIQRNRSSHPEVFLGKDVLKICSKFTGENPCQNEISIKLLCNFCMDLLLSIWCVFSQHLLLSTPLDVCFEICLWFHNFQC